jgi:hypothetical protein
MVWVNPFDSLQSSGGSIVQTDIELLAIMLREEFYNLFTNDLAWAGLPSSTPTENQESGHQTLNWLLAKQDKYRFRPHLPSIDIERHLRRFQVRMELLL